MLISVGDRAPEFTARATTGQIVSLAALRGRLVVVYFFPRASWISLQCVQQTRRFRDNYPELKARGAEVIGISVDPYDRSCKFAETNKVTFPLIADEDRAISIAWGVLRSMMGVDKRVTFVVDETGVVRARFQHAVQVSKHLDDVLAFVRTWREKTAAR